MKQIFACIFLIFIGCLICVLTIYSYQDGRFVTNVIDLSLKDNPITFLVRFALKILLGLGFILFGMIKLKELIFRRR